MVRMMFNVMQEGGKVLEINALCCGVWFSVCDSRRTGADSGPGRGSI
jgi:hypothetical protein